MLNEPVGRPPGIVIVFHEEFMRYIAEVKCYLCSRICGEVDGRDPQELDLRRVQVDVSARRCGLKPGQPLRCSRCGGSIYIGDVECVYGREVLSRN